jgi:hypothetical protein
MQAHMANAGLDQTNHQGISSGVPNPWLFRGSRPGSELSESGLATLLSSAGINVMAIRGAALVDFAQSGDLAVISDILDLCHETALRWWSLVGENSAYVRDRVEATKIRSAASS